MPRLSNTSTFGQRSYPSESLSPQKVFAIAYEGNVTEKSYFNGIKNQKDELGITDNIMVYPLDREDDDTSSHSTHIRNLVDEYVVDYGHEKDEVWMVLDRDKQNNPREQQLKCITEAKDVGYHVALTNPTFELWLLMHISDLSEYPEEELFKNRKTGKKRFLEKTISDILDGYNVKKRSLHPFIDRIKIQKAIMQEKNLCNLFPELLDELGSNVGDLMAKILEI